MSIAANLKLLSKRLESMSMSGPERRSVTGVLPTLWFTRGALGVNTIDRLMEIIATCTKTGLDITSKWFTDHSLHKTAVT